MLQMKYISKNAWSKLKNTVELQTTIFFTTFDNWTKEDEENSGSHWKSYFIWKWLEMVY